MKPLKRVVIKEELVELTGDFKPAIILNQFLYWTERMFDADDYIREENKRASKEDAEVSIEESKGWIYKTAEELNEELMIRMSIPTIRKYIKQLVEAGFIIERRNPKYKWDKTMQYRVDLYKIQLELGKLGYVLEGYKLLPGIKISSVEVEEDEKVAPAPTDTTTNENESKDNTNNINNNSISQLDENIQEVDISIEKIAYENLKDSEIFKKLPQSAKDKLIEREINKIRITMGI